MFSGDKAAKMAEKTAKERKKKKPTLFVNPQASVDREDYGDEENELQTMAYLMQFENEPLKW